MCDRGRPGDQRLGDDVRIEYTNSTDGDGSAQLYMEGFPDGRVPDDWYGVMALPAAAHSDNAGVIAT